MTFRLGAKSRKNLVGVHPAIVAWLGEAILESPIDFTVFEGLRTKAQQRLNVARGVSKTMASKHLTGHAVDIIPLIAGKPTWAWPPYYVLAPYLKKIAKKHGLVVTWGGDWKSWKDGPHWEIDPKKYPMPR